MLFADRRDKRKGTNQTSKKKNGKMKKVINSFEKWS